MGVVLLGGDCAGAEEAGGEVASYGGGGWNIFSFKFSLTLKIVGVVMRLQRFTETSSLFKSSQVPVTVYLVISSADRKYL